MWGAAIDQGDLNQGSIGNCWMIVSMATVANVPQRVKDLFLTEFSNSQGIYSTQMYALGAPVTVTVDDYIPVRELHGKKYTIFTSIPENDNAIWGPIMEKIYSKYYGNYEQTIAGLPDKGIFALTGVFGDFNKNSNYQTAQDIWDVLYSHYQKNSMLTFATAGSNHFTTNDVGLAKGHAYSIVSLHITSTGVKLLKCRNPWGSE